MVVKAQTAAKQQFYEELESFDGSRIYKIAAMRRNQAKGVTSPKYIEDKEGRLLTQEKDICNRWKQYSHQLLNEEFPRSSSRTENPVSGPVEEISLGEVRDAVMKMKRNKAVGPDSIPSEFWKRCGEIGYKFLQILFFIFLYFCINAS